MAATATAEAAEIRAAMIEQKEAEAEDEWAAAHDYQRLGQHGLALVAFDEALAIAPDSARIASERQGAQATATSVVREAQAAATAAVREAQSTATAVAQQAAAEAAAAAQARAQATVVAYARVAPVGQWSGQTGGVSVAVGSFRYLARTDLYVAPRGQRFVVVGVGVANRTQSAIHVNPGNFTLVDQERISHPYDVATFDWCASPLRAVDVRPGNNANGCLIFVMGSSTGPAKILYRPGLLAPDVVVDLERPPDP